jgi:hypothetical protein
MGSPVSAPIRAGTTTTGSSSLANTAHTGTEVERSTSEHHGSGVPAAHNESSQERNRDRDAKSWPYDWPTVSRSGCDRERDVLTLVGRGLSNG